ncbi:MAG: 50S ribosomal protein L4 [Thermoguttaceae bacterium]|nr:50S ribosomal protein L4 [Thermoguttaceae bacterium]MDW8037596.1 50S ribosomal protein L4 [Thermoguttaceae bacterium]
MAVISLPIYDRTGTQVGTYEIDPADLAPRISKQLLHDAVVMYQRNRRQGTVQTRGRGDVAGTTRKMYRQKGTGRARAGSRRTNIRRGGGHTFAKRPMDWSYRLPKKALRLATRMALAARILDREVTLIDQLSMDRPRTAEIAQILKAIADKTEEFVCLTARLARRRAEARRRAALRRAQRQAQAQTQSTISPEPTPSAQEIRVPILDGLKYYRNALLVVVPQYDVNIYRSVRNLPGVSVLPVDQLNALEILRPRRLLMTRAALDAFRQKVVQDKQQLCVPEEAPVPVG